MLMYVVSMAACRSTDDARLKKQAKIAAKSFQRHVLTVFLCCSLASLFGQKMMEACCNAVDAGGAV